MKLEAANALAGAQSAISDDRKMSTNDDVKKVAQDFESLVALELLKTMRKTIQHGKSGGGFDQEMATSMFDEELSKHIASGSAFGIADMMSATLEERMGLTKDDAGTGMRMPARSFSSGGLSAGALQSLNDGTWVQPVDDAPAQFSSGQKFGATRPDHRHAGLDLAQAVGTPVRSAQAGTISGINNSVDSSGGRTVTVEHPGGFTTKYMHMDAIDPSLQVGAPVSAGAALGTVGNTGTSSHGAHLHFELEHNGTHVDPEPFVRSWK